MKTLKRLELVNVTLKKGNKEIRVQAQEVAGLRKEGLLKGKAPVKKEDKTPVKTKEEKKTGETKASDKASAEEDFGKNKNIVSPKDQ